MIAIKRNSTEFKQLRRAFEEYSKKPSRKKLIRLYALKPSETLDEKILLNTLKKDGEILYEMSYNSILEYFMNPSEKLYREEKEPLYYFKSSPRDSWIKFPFELAGKLKKEFFPLSVVR
jgi:hypothetical protein